jgi:hypothetical protein
MGDIREDGFIFRTLYKDKSGNVKEHWLSPMAFKNWQEKRNLCSRKNYSNHLAKERQRGKNYRKANPHQGNARAAKRRANKIQATPIWLTPDHIQEIQDFYLMAKQLEKVFPWKQEVDHIEPLQGVDVCGLHVPWNLQILPMANNRSKGIKRDL